MESALTFLQRYHGDCDEFLDRIVTGDETWVAHITPETKQQLMHLRGGGSTWKTKFMQNFVGTESKVYGVLRQTGHSPRRHPDRR